MEPKTMTQHEKENPERIQTYIYLVRHGESPKKELNERTRGLTEKGRRDADRVTELLKDEGIDVLISSPYERAVLTIAPLANFYGKKIVVYEHLKECMFLSKNKVISDRDLKPLVKKMFSDPNCSLPGGETRADCQRRSVAVLKELLKNFKGQNIVIGTHGLVMTLMMNYFDPTYGHEFLMQATKPDIYRMAFNGEKLIDVKRVWAG